MRPFAQKIGDMLLENLYAMTGQHFKVVRHLLACGGWELTLLI